MLRRWRRRRGLAKVEAGDGRALPPYRFWQPFSRSLFYLDLADGDYRSHYAVDYRRGIEESRADLYRDGRQVATSTLPAALPVPGGVVEVNSGTLGLTRMHFVSDDGREQVLRPDARSAEGLRRRFGRRYPGADRIIRYSAIVVLALGLIVLAPQLLDWVTRIDWVSDRIGHFTNPIDLPGWASVTLLIAGLVAGLERALTLRNHWLLDAETFWLG